MLLCAHQRCSLSFSRRIVVYRVGVTHVLQCFCKQDMMLDKSKFYDPRKYAFLAFKPTKACVSISAFGWRQSTLLQGRAASYTLYSCLQARAGAGGHWL